jgi:hypothetical protein
MFPGDFRERAPRVAIVLDHRLRCLAWWRAVLQRWPGGVVPPAQACRIMGFKRPRLDRLIADGRIPKVDPMPGDLAQNFWIPVDALFSCSSPLDAGRPRVINATGTPDRATPAVNPLCDPRGSPPSGGKSTGKTRFHAESSKSVPVRDLRPK